MLSTFLSLAATAVAVSALNNGRGKLPAMGYDTYNAFAENYNTSVVEAQARVMRDTGLIDAGYNIMILDDFYALKQRNATGYMVEDPDKFPDGLPALSKYLKGLGIDLAAYGDSGYATCGGYPGSYGHELQDLETWHSWGMSYLKFDNCNFPTDNITQQNIYGRYTRMKDAIAQFAQQTNVTFELSLCEWGLEQPWVWGRYIGQAWRINNDIKPWWSSIATIITQASYNYWASGFYGHNDLDIMEVGNDGKGSPPGNLTFDEMKSHFTAWAFLKSPLIIGTDLSTASNETLEILGNKDIIRFNQDPNVSESISPFRWANNSFEVGNPNFPQVYWPSDPFSPAQYWSGNSSHGVVFMLLNTENVAQEMQFALSESWAIRSGRQYSVYDMWEHKDMGIAVRNWTIQVPPHGVAALLLNDAGPEPSRLNGTCANEYFCGTPESRDQS